MKSQIQTSKVLGRNRPLKNSLGYPKYSKATQTTPLVTTLRVKVYHSMAMIFPQSSLMHHSPAASKSTREIQPKSLCNPNAEVSYSSVSVAYVPAIPIPNVSSLRYPLPNRQDDRLSKALAIPSTSKASPFEASVSKPPRCPFAKPSVIPTTSKPPLFEVQTIKKPSVPLCLSLAPARCGNVRPPKAVRTIQSLCRKQGVPSF
jgi:hypothetical protein